MKVIVKLIVCGVLAVVGSVFSFLVPGIITRNYDKCTEEVTAIVVDLRADEGDTTLYAPVYEAVVNGKTETLSSNTYTDPHPEIGDERTLKVNPDDPSQFYDPVSDGLLLKIFKYIGWGFLAFAVIVLFLPIR